MASSTASSTLALSRMGTPGFLKVVLASLRGVAFEPRDPDYFAGPGFRQQEPELVSEMHQIARG